MASGLLHVANVLDDAADYEEPWVLCAAMSRVQCKGCSYWGLEEPMEPEMLEAKHAVWSIG